MVDTAKDLTVVGSIEVDGKMHRVALPLPLLVQDGMLYMGLLAARYFEEAEKSKASAAALRTLGANKFVESSLIGVGVSIVDDIPGVVAAPAAKGARSIYNVLNKK
jgi:hypothetical protein